MGALPRRDRAFFGRRKGHKLRPHHARLIDTLLPKLALDLSQPAPAELSALFPVPVADVQLEIGFGGGEFIVGQAREKPARGFVGVEPFVNGMAKALAAIEIERSKKHPAAFRRRCEPDRLAAGKVA